MAINVIKDEDGIIQRIIINDEVLIRGWKKGTGVNIEDALKHIKSLGLSEIIFTDTQRDGMLEGFNIDVFKKVLDWTDINMIASGSLIDIPAKPGVYSDSAPYGP